MQGWLQILKNLLYAGAECIQKVRSYWIRKLQGIEDEEGVSCCMMNFSGVSHTGFVGGHSPTALKSASFR
jgi:hypothetical protein